VSNIAWLSLLNQAAFNMERMQNIGFTATMAPALRKIYKDQPEALAAALEDNMEFVNTHNVTQPFLTALMVSLYEKGESVETVRNIKVSLFGPLAGIGDALFWFTLMPIMAGISASLANNGSVLGPILYFLVFLAAFILRFPLAHWGYDIGTRAFALISANARRVNQAATILGVTILGGLIANYVALSTPLEVPIGDGNTIALQTEFFDKIIPNILPLAFTFGILALLRKKVNPALLIILIIVAAVILSVVGVL
jgi:PTS system galactosamine-specific IID component